MNVNDIREHFITELKQENFVETRNGKMIELVGASFLADEDAIFGRVNWQYVNAEIEWYHSMSSNVNVLNEIYGKVPVAWQHTSNKHGETNSNYGRLIFSKVYHDQYGNVLNELSRDPNSRRATMVYTRPNIWNEYNDNEKNDFICTNAVTYYIRDGRLDCVVQMRSNDVVFGYKNDRAWQQHVLDMLSGDLGIQPGKIHWQVQNLHVYERHFDMVTAPFTVTV